MEKKWISFDRFDQSDFLSRPLTMHFCEFCGKGPFPSSSGLNKHMRHSVNCNKTARQKWGSFATTMWDNAPGPSNIEQQPPASPPILEDDELPNMPDIALEEDLQALEDDLADTTITPHCPQSPAPAPPGPEMPPAQPESLRATVDDAYYIEEFPADLGAGAIWGEEVPVFEKLWQEQKAEGSSRWGPFENQNEWELAEWLIKNIGQKQTDAFLNLNIVRSHRLEKFGRSLIAWTFNRHANK
jgi:hypothetical protein